MQRNVYVPSHVDSVNFIILYSTFSLKNNKFPNIKNRGEQLLEQHVRLINNKFSREKKIKMVAVYGNNEKYVAANKYQDAITIINERFSETGDARSICLALYNMNAENCFIMDGRYGWSENIFDEIRSESMKNPFVLLGNKCDNIIGSVVNDSRPEILMHSSPNKYSGISFINGRSMKMLRDLVNNPDNEKLLSFEIINKLIEKDKNFSAIVDHNIETVLCS